MSYNPSSNAFSKVIAKCYEQKVSFGSIVTKCGFSNGTATNDRANPQNIPLKRLTLYMETLGIRELTIKLEGDD